MDDNTFFLKRSMVARRLGVSARSLTKLAARWGIRPIHINTHVFYSARDVEKLVVRLRDEREA